MPTATLQAPPPPCTTQPSLPHPSPLPRLPRPGPLTDFGFANRSALKNALLSTFCGSVAYTAPEILMSKKYNGERADMWSL